MSAGKRDPSGRPWARPNLRGTLALARREVLRAYAKSWIEVLLGPALQALLYILVFGVASAGMAASLVPPGGSVVGFIAPGLIVQAAGAMAFSSAAFIVLWGKLEGSIADVLAAPLSPGEFVAGHVAGAALTGLGAGLVVAVVLWLAVPLAWPDPVGAALVTALASAVFAALGVIAGQWARSWDHFGAIDGFVALPLLFLSGAFFPLDRLPEPLAAGLRFAPAFPAVDGVRAGVSGGAEAGVVPALVALSVWLVAACLVSRVLVARGWRLKG